MFVAEVSEDELVELFDDFLLELEIRDAKPLAVVHKDNAVVVFDFLDFSTVVSYLLEVKFFLCFMSNYFPPAVLAFLHEVVAFYSELQVAIVPLHILEKFQVFGRLPGVLGKVADLLIQQGHHQVYNIKNNQKGDLRDRFL